MSFNLQPPPTGEYNIFAVNYRVTPPEQRPLGISRTNGETTYRIVLLPAGSIPTKFFFIEQGRENKYSITASGIPVLPLGNHPAAVDASLTTYTFLVERSIPSLPPIGQNSFVIYTHPAPAKGQFWAPISKDKDETPVIFQDVGHLWFITSATEL